MRTFLTFRTQIVFAYFSKKSHFYKKKTIFVHNHPKNTIFLGFFLMFVFQFFSCFLFFFLQHKKDKNKKCTFFFETPFFDNLTNCQKNIFAPLHTICVFLRCPENTIKLGKTSKKNLGPSFDATLDQVLTQKTPNLGPSFDSTANIYIYAVVLLSGPSLAFWGVIIWAKFAFYKTLFVKNTIKRGFSTFFLKKKLRAQIWGVIIWAKLVIFKMQSTWPR